MRKNITNEGYIDLNELNTEDLKGMLDYLNDIEKEINNIKQGIEEQIDKVKRLSRIIEANNIRIRILNIEEKENILEKLVNDPDYKQNQQKLLDYIKNFKTKITNQLEQRNELGY